MKRLLLFILVLFCVVPLVASTPTYSTYFGGSCDEIVSSMSGGNAGDIYITGYTDSTDFPTTPGAFQATKHGGYDAFVTKLDSTGSVVWATYLGGSGDDFGRDVRADPTGTYIYVTGTTNSADFPTTAGVYQSNNKGGKDIFVTKFNAADGTVIYSTYLGGSGADVGVSIAVDNAGNAYITGNTDSTDFPTTAGAFQTTKNGGQDIFVAKLSSDGTSLTYSTYIGGSGDDFGQVIRPTSATQWVQAGIAFLTGYTNSSDLPTTAGAYQTTKSGGYDAFVIKLNPDGSLAYSTYLGGNDKDVGSGISWDDNGDAIVTGYTISTDFPTTIGAFQVAKNGGYDAFVTRINSAGTTILYSTYFGGSGDDYGQGSREDAGNTYITGNTDSPDLPVTANAFQSSKNSGHDAFVTKFNPTNNTILFSTYLGGSGDDFGGDVRVAGSDVYIDGHTNSTDFPVTTGALQSVNNGGNDAFVMKINTGIDATVQTSVAGLTFTVDGVTYGSTQDFSWAPGSSHTIATTTPQSGGAGVRYCWTGWSDGGAISHTVVAPTKNKIYTAHFTTQYYLTMSAGTGGHISPGSSWHTSGTTFSISATPGTAYSFGGWTGSGAGSYSGTNNPASITMVAPITEAAAFTHN